MSWHVLSANMKKMKADALDIIVGIKEEEKKVHINLELQHVEKIIKLQALYGV